MNIVPLLLLIMTLTLSPNPAWRQYDSRRTSAAGGR
jgi:hypothetical protein